MGMQDIVMSDRRLTNFVMSRLPETAHARKGEKLALSVARAAMQRTRAYPRLLKSMGLPATPPATMTEFASLPVIDKRSYIDPNSIDDLALDGCVHAAYTIERSSGHAGGSHYWLRLPEEDALFPRYLEHAFTQFYRMDSRSTLVLITLALGTWTSGEKMAQALREVAASGKYPLTVMAPGTNSEEILEIVADLGGSYDQVVIVGYPPFLKTVIDEGCRRGIEWHRFGVKLGLGGEGYSEQWREHVGRLIGVDTSKDLLAISGGYGAADVGMSIGREYPLTVLIRKLCMADKTLADALFDHSRRRQGILPGLLQYSPGSCHIEEVDGELVFTVLSGIPLVRYNIHDNGGVLGFEAVMQTLHDHGYDVLERLAELGYGREQVWRLPFFYVFGRSDGTVSIVGANIFPENVQSVLSEAGDQHVVNFKLAVRTGEDFSQKLAISLEHHAEDLSDSECARFAVRYRDLLVLGLRRLNQDFRDAYDDNPECADPIVTVHARGSGPFKETGSIKNHYV